MFACSSCQPRRRITTRSRSPRRDRRSPPTSSRAPDREGSR
jgi:hypothetical protein